MTYFVKDHDVCSFFSFSSIIIRAVGSEKNVFQTQLNPANLPSNFKRITEVNEKFPKEARCRSLMDAVIIPPQREQEPSSITPTQRGRDPLGCACFVTLPALLMSLPCKSVEGGGGGGGVEREKSFFSLCKSVGFIRFHPHQPSAAPSTPPAPARTSLQETTVQQHSYFWQDYITSPSVSVHGVVPRCSLGPARRPLSADAPSLKEP